MTLGQGDILAQDNSVNIDTPILMQSNRLTELSSQVALDCGRALTINETDILELAYLAGRSDEVDYVLQVLPRRRDIQRDTGEPIE